jgi:murein DD-endopeptidase MepM/ murein hydrolase activator NlpD
VKAGRSSGAWKRGIRVCAGIGALLAGPAGAWELALPTDNRALFSEDPSRFYMYTDRNFEGVRSTPWTAGQYGFVRDQKRTAEGILFVKFHEGLDIRPVLRDAAGEPMDLVRAISPGRVVHVAADAARSSYGKYVVVRHDWPEGPLFSLYAHLRDTRVKVGETVTARSVVGRLGYTGDGINRERAHLHLELNLLLSDRFERWHAPRFRTPNHHGNYNGLNLVGIDLGRLFRERQAKPDLDIPGLLAGEPVHHKVRVPYRGKMPLAERYPFLVKGPAVSGQASWEIHFNAAGVPLALVPSTAACDGARVTWVERSATYHAYKTRGRLTGSGASAGLSDTGLSYLDLVTGRF